MNFGSTEKVKQSPSSTEPQKVGDGCNKILGLPKCAKASSWNFFRHSDVPAVALANF